MEADFFMPKHQDDKDDRGLFDETPEEEAERIENDWDLCRFLKEALYFRWYAHKF